LLAKHLARLLAGEEASVRRPHELLDRISRVLDVALNVRHYWGTLR